MSCAGLGTRALTAGEWDEELHGIYLRYLRDAGVAVNPAALREFLHMLLRHDWILALGAIHEGRLVGFAIGNLTYTNLRFGLALHLGDLFVDRDYRGTGASERLMADMRALAAQRGAKRIFGNATPRVSKYLVRRGWKDSGQRFLYWDVAA